MITLILFIYINLFCLKLIWVSASKMHVISHCYTDLRVFTKQTVYFYLLTVAIYFSINYIKIYFECTLYNKINCNYFTVKSYHNLIQIVFNV